MLDSHLDAKLLILQ